MTEPGAFVPVCLLCDDDAPCAFHGATNPVELAQAFVSELKAHKALGFGRMLLASLAGVENSLPARVTGVLRHLDSQPLQTRLTDLLKGNHLTADDLREIAALSLAWAMIADARERSKAQPRPGVKAG